MRQVIGAPRRIWGIAAIMNFNDFIAECLFHLIRRRAVNNNLTDDDSRSAASYSAWRSNELAFRFDNLVDSTTVAGKDVLDFGCGSGGLALAVAGLGARTVSGIDLNASFIAEATAAADAAGAAVDFRRATRIDAIEFDDDAFD